MTNLQTVALGDPAMFEPLTGDENNILWAHLCSGWYKQAAVYPALSEPWQDTGGLLDDLLQARQASRQAWREPEAGQ
ncbi:MAG: hypothetical protein ACRDPY_15505 [Streptosporangiaceae bacterium]